MQFNNITTENGIIQKIEFWTSIGPGVVSGDSELLKLFTGLVNDSYNDIMPDLLKSDSNWRFDDINNIDFPIAYTDIKNGQKDYLFTSDSTNNSILDIDKVYVATDASATELITIEPIDPRDNMHDDILSGSTPDSFGIPSGYIKIGSSIIFDVVPDYNAISGLRVVFRRTPNYFTITDTTKQPGIPAIFHELLPLIASYNWVLVNKADNSMLITRLEKKIADKRKELKSFMNSRSEDSIVKMRVRSINAY